jgi:hypothetical protein
MQTYSGGERPARSDSPGCLMTVRKVLPALLMGLFASLTFTAPSEAGTTTVTTTSFLFAPVSVSDLVVTYDVGGLSVTNLTLLGTIPDGVILSFNEITDTADVHYSSPVDATGGTVQQFSFEVASPISSASGNIKVLDIDYLQGDPGPIAPTSYSVTFSNASVPEPGSMALLGIGMTSFIAFRRWLKRRPSSV